MSEQNEQHRATEGESEGFVDRVKDFFGIRDEPDDQAQAEPEYAEDQPAADRTGDTVRESGADERDRHDVVDDDELQEALDEIAVDGQPNAEEGELDTPIGQEPGRGSASERGRGPVKEPGDGGRHTRHDVTREGDKGRGRSNGPGRDAPKEPGDAERHTRHDVRRETASGTSATDGGGTAEATDATVAADDTPQTTGTEDTGTQDTDTEDTDTEDTAGDRAQRDEDFAREHDPEQHDIDAGEEFRQRGDWTAEEAGGPQVQDASGEIHEPDTAQAADADAPGSQDAQSTAGPVESSIDEVRDGGHGVGSAAPLEDGRQPFGHPVKAWNDSMTFVLPGEEGYDAAPHEWFTDREAAERAGFRHAHGG